MEPRCLAAACLPSRTIRACERSPLTAMAQNINLTIANNGEKHAVRRLKPVTVTLEGNTSAGYMWYRDKFPMMNTDTSDKALTVTRVFQPGGMVATSEFGAGRFVFTLTPKLYGTYKVKLLFRNVLSPLNPAAYRENEFNLELVVP